MENIETLHGISIGSILSVVLCLNYDWDDLDAYFVERPWHKSINSDIYTLFNSIQTCGIYDRKFFNTLLGPLLKGKNIDLKITMNEFYQLYGKKIYLYATEAVSLNSVYFSHETTPDVELLDAIHASCCIPGVFTPCYIDNVMYFDGGIRMYIPIDKCLDVTQEEDNDTLFAMQCIRDSKPNVNTDNIFTLLTSLIYIIITNIVIKQSNTIRYLFSLDVDGTKTIDFSETINSKDFRMELIEYGYSCATNYFK
jgi:predicted acylesterase/phospholipase RssA